MNRGKYADEIQQCRKRRRDADGQIALTHELCDNKRRRTHNGRHNLSACGGGGFYRSGELGLIARLFHQRNGKGACCRNICQAGTADRTKQRTGQHRSLGGAANTLTENAYRYINQHTVRFDLRHKRTQQTEQENEAGRSAQRHTENTFGREDHMPHKGRKRAAAMCQRSREVLAENRIQNEDRRNQNQRIAQNAAGTLQDQHDQQQSHDQV